MKSFLSLLLFISSFALSATGQRAQPDYKKIGASIPPFRINLMNNSPFTGAMLQAKPTVIMIFSPTCDHCEKVMDTLKMHARELAGKAQFVFVAEATHRAQMQGFIQKLGLGSIPMFKNMGTEASNLIYYLYQYQALPQVNVYSAQGKLRKTWTTQVPVAELVQMLR